ncbi:aminotransferase-like domain-containing protein [Rugamonas rivuli]|uniref:Aminotransferase class I/II-fold pyridoxal phosphate-dependent enzyme n=1 Tax=Rugamonas rivuli TaxID=2743358 RepID=A0A843SGJ3_9BURK|nr:PLP-dependent aminotransferase family protein [Rugamonas rivuli]MQA23745.1 aminotransferase class I/II-fold pyridoxal phosphate-dependent enzyme [Rugamonas rivuli]
MQAFSRSAASGLSVIEQVVDYFAAAIEARELTPGAKLPSIRSFALAGGISKSTAVEAYDRLVAQGLAVSRAKSGFFVSTPRPVLEIGRPAAAPLRQVDEFWMLRNALQLPPHALRPGCGWLPPDYLNDEGIRRVLGSLRRDPGDGLTAYGEPAGYRPLREQLQRHLDGRGVAAPLDGIVLTDSGSQALDLAIRLLVQPGDTVFVDDPCYFNFQASLRAHRVHVVGIPLTPNGPDMQQFEAELARHRPRLYITNTVLQNPTGISFAAAVVHRILLLSQQHGFAIIEDDTFADLEERPAVRLAALDQLQNVIYIGSFSKTLSGATRCGYLVAKQEWVEAILDLKLATTFGNNELSARLISRLLLDGSYRKHTEAIRQRLRKASVSVRKRLRDSGLEPWAEPAGGPFLWVQGGADMDASAIAGAGLKADILFAPGNVFSVSNTAGRFLRFNVAYAHDPRIFAFLKKRMR